MSNKAELLKKIKALADRGVDGERESAQTLLARLMEQYGISETDLEEERRETAWFRYSQETERRLLNQIIYMVTGRSGFGCVGSYSGRKRKETGVNCTAAERLEIEANYKFFKVAMEAELEIFYTAFSSKNHLFPSEDKVKPKSIKDLTPEEREKGFESWLDDGGNRAAHITQGHCRGRNRVKEDHTCKELFKTHRRPRAAVPALFG